MTRFEQICPVSTVWSENLKKILLEWQEETGNTPQPVPAIQEYLYEMLAEQGRSKNMGNGLFLATAHAVKGLEFDHVFILGDSWRNAALSAIEDERRLYYVSMSRARETLHLFSLASAVNPHLAALHGEFLTREKFFASREENRPARAYHLLGMEDFFIDFAGIKQERHPSRLVLPDINAGDIVNIAERNHQVELVNKDGIPFARLSRKAQAAWSGKLSTIKEIRVIAMVRRYREDAVETNFQENCFGTSWEFPIVEVIC